MRIHIYLLYVGEKSVFALLLRDASRSGSSCDTCGDEWYICMKNAVPFENENRLNIIYFCVVRPTDNPYYTIQHASNNNNIRETPTYYICMLYTSNILYGRRWLTRTPRSSIAFTAILLCVKKKGRRGVAAAHAEEGNFEWKNVYSAAQNEWRKTSPNPNIWKHYITINVCVAAVTV